MATVTLDDTQEQVAKVILKFARDQIQAVSQGNEGRAFAVRRYVYIRLQMDERGTPASRKKLKMTKFDEQKGICPICGERIEKIKGTHLHRKNASEGYSSENVELVHAQCHGKQQEQKDYK
jgi:hypothetical protein